MKTLEGALLLSANGERTTLSTREYTYKFLKLRDLLGRYTPRAELDEVWSKSCIYLTR